LKARLALLVERWFPREVFLELISRGFQKIGEKTWVVPVERVSEFQMITGLTLEPSETDLSALRKEKNVEIVEAKVEKKTRGSNGFQVILGEGVYHVVVREQGRAFKVPVEIVDAYYDALMEFKRKGVKRVKKRDLAAEALRRIGFTKYFSKDGTRFHWEAFYGDRVRYHTHYYFPVKILEARGLLRVTQQDEIVII